MLNFSNMSKICIASTFLVLLFSNLASSYDRKWCLRENCKNK